MKTKPGWLDKHPCTACGVGYGECAQGYVISLMCCAGCAHPGRWVPNPYTAEEIAEMMEPK